jgi:2-polyprenyl-6-hydroxyphenyl methylase/3-demethylubiquinone-9 3-methyltransferase
MSAEVRFAFGKNWLAFLRGMNETRIAMARKGLADLLGGEGLVDRRFLDAGCGSGIHSLAARRMGASVVSFDYDRESVACARELKRRYCPDDPGWCIAQGSVLDGAYLEGLGRFDVVYSWGVLHHTGRMWDALGALQKSVSARGYLVLALYNDQGWLSRFWRVVKRTYGAGTPGRWTVKTLFIPFLALRAVIAGCLKYGGPLGQFRHYHRNRGMSLYRDWVDWLGGYPFEVARPQEVVSFLETRGFRLIRSFLTRSFGCNQFVFVKSGPR